MVKYCRKHFYWVTLKVDGRGDIAQYAKYGTLDDWQQKVALPCRGNPYLIAGLSFSFVGPLLELLNIPGIAIHYFGYSTSGKTSAQFLAASTWGSPRFLLTWSGTVNGLESQASSRSSTLTLLDESHLIDPRQLDAGIYLLLNGVAKSRMARDATAKSIARWLAAIFSSGERSTRAHLTTKMTDHKAGQGVRMIDVPVIARYGIFDSLHNWASAKEFAENLKEAAAQDYGHAGPEFVEYLINNKANLDLKQRLITTTATMTAGIKLSAQELRVLRSFALIAVAGELAIKAGILPWDSGSVQFAAKQLFDKWRAAQPHGGTSREHAQILEKISDFIERHRDTRFTDVRPKIYTEVINGVAVTKNVRSSQGLTIAPGTGRMLIICEFTFSLRMT